MVEPKRASSGKRRSKISAALTGGEDKLNRHWRGTFLAGLAETSNVTAASAAAGVHPSRPYKVRRHEPEFARAWRAALLEGYEHLEMELLHRLRFGEPKDAEMKFDNTAALRLLGLRRDTVARERAIRVNEDLAAVRASIQAKLAQLREQVIARREEAANHA
ncbi:hypothetical protein GCM10011494_03680 [Novosphingobium endophyticum]|uniref:Uncharacterized protein n=1 Tax=Novosphingobium endophyticum TaxID=1955250 RepID=A0A916TRV9_9SPHN|nr:hypothetical protein [Novosphingobium endophyticum]GGB88653.1 hypothetical protein GCM10011494_03680 [Novosphingobium endophyticum]